MADSESVRQWIIEAYGRNKKTGEIAALFGRCPSGVRRVKQQARERGDARPRFHLRGSRGKFTPECQAALREWIRLKPDQTLAELRERMEKELKVNVSTSTVDRWTKKLGLTFKKKSLPAAEQDRPDVSAQRQCLHDQLKDLDPRKLVFIDQSGAKTNFTRLRGRAPSNERLVCKAPGGHWQTTTMIAAICLGDDQHRGGAIAGAAIDGATDTDVFVAWVKHALVPCLTIGMVVIMDNLRPHKSPQISTMIRAAGCTLLYLPPYSPDFNPIEPMWSKVKSISRTREPRTKEVLHDAIFDALESVTESDAKGFFTRTGYLSPET